MSDVVYALLKSGKAYDRSIIEHAIEGRREQAAHVARSHAKQSLVRSRPRKSRLAALAAASDVNDRGEPVDNA